MKAAGGEFAIISPAWSGLAQPFDPLAEGPGRACRDLARALELLRDAEPEAWPPSGRVAVFGLFVSELLEAAAVRGAVDLAALEAEAAEEEDLAAAAVVLEGGDSADLEGHLNELQSLPGEESVLELAKMDLVTMQVWHSLIV